MRWAYEMVRRWRVGRRASLLVLVFQIAVLPLHVSAQIASCGKPSRHAPGLVLLLDHHNSHSAASSMASIIISGFSGHRSPPRQVCLIPFPCPPCRTGSTGPIQFTPISGLTAALHALRQPDYLNDPVLICFCTPRLRSIILSSRPHAVSSPISSCS